MAATSTKRLSERLGGGKGLGLGRERRAVCELPAFTTAVAITQTGTSPTPAFGAAVGRSARAN